MASTIVSRTQSGAESAAGRRTWTFSCWVKKTGIINGGSNQELFGSDSNGARSNNYNIIDFNSNDCLDVVGYESGLTFRKITNRKFRDTNAWFHLVVAFDTTQSTADDRIKIYINGVRETSFSTSTNPSQDHQGKFFASNKVHAFGRGSQAFDGLISHVHATEGTAYAPTVFGSTDATTGEWKINADPTVSYGTNGFFLFKNDNSVTNQAGNSSGNFAVTAGTLTKSEDCPSNVFATLNPLVRNKSYNDGSFTNGNTGYAPNGRSIGCTTLGVTSGKYYAEFKATDAGALYIGAGLMSGITSQGQTNPIWYDNSTSYAIGYGANGSLQYNTTSTSYGSGFSDNDIVGIALDMDNKEMYISVNGTWQNSGDPTSGSSKTGGVTGATSYNPFDDGDEVFLFVSDFSASGVGECQCNFGNGYFGTTAVSSAGTNASNNGIFEYDVPTGYTALSTKGLNL